MLVDTHCHINMMIKDTFDMPLEKTYQQHARTIIQEAQKHNVTTIINVGTSLVESQNSILLAQTFDHVYATVGIHPNDCTENWKSDLSELKKIIRIQDNNTLVGIGEIGIDRHYPDYNIQRQSDAFKAQIELALENNFAIVVHSRDAADETLAILDIYRTDITHCVIHCFSYDYSIAQECIARGFKLGIGGTCTYPKNNDLRTIITNILLTDFVLETDAPFLPPQKIRGQKNHPLHIETIAQFIAQLRNEPFEHIAQQTTTNAYKLFGLET